MDRASLDSIELAYELRGAGEPVVLVHHGAGVDWFEPLSEEPALAGSFRILRSHRVGYGSSTPSAGPLDFREDAAHCRALLRHLGLERAHVVGHSSSAMIALQLALDAPDAVQTLSLLESAPPAPQNQRQAEFVSSVLMPALERYTAGDKAGAIDAWLQGVCGPDYRAALERALPDAFEQALADADRYFGQELPAVQRWPFTEADAGRVTQPALVVVGAQSGPVFHERAQLLLDWLPNAEPYELPEASHLLSVQNPRDMAGALARFFTRHPITASG